MRAKVVDGPRCGGRGRRQAEIVHFVWQLVESPVACHFVQLRSQRGHVAPVTSPYGRRDTDVQRDDQAIDFIRPDMLIRIAQADDYNLLALLEQPGDFFSGAAGQHDIVGVSQDGLAVDPS
ncbi:MAG TPA: hypothetical protein VMK84_32685 [Streptosporangiaceae bacterium]|nr:hypothetical protein [Streptosporangiaceae bacterium]